MRMHIGAPTWLRTLRPPCVPPGCLLRLGGTFLGRGDGGVNRRGGRVNGGGGGAAASHARTTGGAAAVAPDIGRGNLVDAHRVEAVLAWEGEARVVAGGLRVDGLHADGAFGRSGGRSGRRCGGIGGRCAEWTRRGHGGGSGGCGGDCRWGCCAWSWRSGRGGTTHPATDKCLLGMRPRWWRRRLRARLPSSFARACRACKRVKLLSHLHRHLVGRIIIGRIIGLAASF